LGAGALSRAEILDRLGVKDFARVAQLSAEESFRLLLSKHKQEEQTAWTRFEMELTKRTAEIKNHHQDELQTLGIRIKELESVTKVSDQQREIAVQRVRAELESRVRSEELEKERANRRAEDQQREAEQLREQNRTLETELSKVARVGRREEVDFAEEARTWAGIHVGDKLPKNGDFILAFRDLGGAPLDPKILVDCKDKSAISEADICKLVRDAKERSIAVAAVVARDENQLRRIDKETRWAINDGVWVLRTTRSWLRRDLDVLEPLLQQMRLHGTDFLDNNAALAEEVRHTFGEIDRIDKELGKAARAITSASGLVTKYRVRLQSLCDNTAAPKIPPSRRQPNTAIAQAGD
jgi:hypothetical protein